ncbi:MAG: hypothetical protein WCO57_15845 [Verrucomicrobiota bacterium]
MKAIYQQIPDSYPASHLKCIDPSEERPADREVRRLRGLSAEVGRACNAWLNGRGIKVRTWGNFSPNRSKGKGTRMKLEFLNEA